MTTTDRVKVTLPADFGQLFSATGEVLRSGDTGHVTKREASIYGLGGSPARAAGGEVERLQALATSHSVQTNAQSVQGLQAALRKAGVQYVSDEEE